MSKTIASESIKNPLTRSGLDKKSLCDYVVNIATGCLHSCNFCYVPSTPTVRMRGQELRDRGVEDPQMNWGEYLFIRENLPESLERQLKSQRTWVNSASGRGVVMLCSTTDPYQNSQCAKVTRAAVKILLQHNKRVRILTRSPLWVKDLDILTHPNVTVGMSIPHADDVLSRRIEPGAPLPEDRLKAMKVGFKAGCRLYVAMAPTPPMMGYREFYRHLETLMQFEPEVIFFEPVNARGSNGKPMAAAGLEWAKDVMEKTSWASNFLRQWACLEAAAKDLDDLGCSDRLHIWTDSGLSGHLPQDEIEKWWYKPTPEKWN
jgi:DNA repair photolyase